VTADDQIELDLDSLVREIERDARERRRSGAYPPGFDAELDELFARFAPPAASGDLRALVDEAEEHGLIEPFIPVESQKPAGRYVKRGFAKALGWYHTWLTQEISQFAGAAVRALRVVADRLAAIERRLGDAAELERVLLRLPCAPPPPEAVAAVAAALAGCRGRVFVGRAASGELVHGLTGARIDAYGVEPNPELRERAEALDLDLLPDDVASHLDTVARGALAAIVLAGPDVDAMPAGRRLALLAHARSRLQPAAPLVVVATAPDRYREREPVAADLAAAGPFAAATWVHVLRDAGYTECVARRAADAIVATGYVPATRA
jgi:hypothetical protein